MHRGEGPPLGGGGGGRRIIPCRAERRDQLFAKQSVARKMRPSEEWAATLDPRSERAISATAAAARRKGVWEISKELRGGEAHDIALTVQ